MTVSHFRLYWQRIVLLGIVCTLSFSSYSQTGIDSIISKLNPEKWAASIENKAQKLEAKIIAKTTKTLHRLQRQEEKIYRRMLATKDSLTAKAALADIQEKYKGLKAKLTNPSLSGKGGLYIPKLDTITTALRFLDQNGAAGKIKDAFTKAGSLQGRFSQAEEIERFIKDRRAQLKQQLEQLGLVKELKRFTKEIHYYGAQIKEYRELLKDSKKAERKALELLSKTKLFNDFMRRNSQLASLFRLPGDPDNPVTQASLAGLQTRSQVNALIGQRLAIGGPNAQQQFQQNLQQAQSELNTLKEKLLKMGSGGSTDMEMPDFKPNQQKTKSLFKRLEWGTNMQTQKATGFFPITSDIGLSVGYKLNDKSIIGIGSSFKMGWGTGWRNISVSSQGVGLRSFLDYQVKGSFWISGGYEMNYRNAINNINQLKDYSSWQRSGLLGMTKVVSLKTKFFKKTKLQLLWDFLSYQQVPRTQPVLFRIGYAF